MSWETACTIDELQNGPVIFKRERLQIAIYQTSSGLFAIDNRCPHEGYPLAEGTIDDQCVLTCNWHNWKFRLDDGECILGGDHVRAYKVRQNEDNIQVNLKPLPPEVSQRRIVGGLKVAFQKQEYGRICREISRLHFSGLEPLTAVRESIRWAYDKFEYGTTHAFAACADWLSLYTTYPNDWNRRLVCLAETVNHMAYDALRHPRYAYFTDSIDWEPNAFCQAVEQEDRVTAESMLSTATTAIKQFEVYEEALTRSALAHYNDFGHSLIYVQKARELIGHLGNDYLPFVLIPLARHLCFTTREDLLPEFSGYGPTLEQCPDVFGDIDDIDDLSGLRTGGIGAALGWTSEAIGRYQPEAVYDALLLICAENLLHFDLHNERRVNNSVADNVGWLGFTHAITFANAVREQCSRFPDLWKSGLLQMACFIGRNQRFRDLSIELKSWEVEDTGQFISETHDIILDSGIRDPIFGAHYLKTTIAVQAELPTASSSTKRMLLAALNRFIHSPIKQKHARRLANQAIALVARDYP